MSSEKRSYELKARAEAQRETRERITRAAAELHEEVGVARTTVAEIARRAGVQRPTVYNHFPGLGDLLPACSRHYAAKHPFPDLGAAFSLEDPVVRVRATLENLYRWYRETEPMMAKLTADRSSVPALDEFMRSNSDRALTELAGALTRGFGASGLRADRLRGLLAVALDFGTWRRLAGEGLDDTRAADLMSRAVAAV